VKTLDPRLLRCAAASRRYVATATSIAVGTAVLVVVSAFAISELVVRPFQDHAKLGDLRTPLIVLALTVVARAGLAWGAQATAHRASAAVKSQLRRGLLEHVVRLGPAWLARRQTGELATRATYGTDALDGYFAKYLPALAGAAVMPVVIIAVIFSQDVVAGLIIVGTIPLIPLFAVLIGRGTESVTRRQWRRLAVLGGHFLDVVRGLPTLLLFGRADAQADAIRRRADEHRQATMRSLRLAFLSSAALDFVATMSVAVVAVSVGLRLLNGSLDLRTGLVVLILAPEVYWPLREAGAQFHASAEGLAAAESIFAVTQTPAPRPGARVPVDIGRTTIRIEGVSVRYDSARPPVQCADLTVHPGEYVGVAGPSGCGKTTLLWLLLGFVAPATGRVVLDGPHGRIELADTDLARWRTQLAWVPQDPWLASASITDNVLLARPGAEPAAVGEALRLAHATDFVEALPDGAATVLGENGLGLSAGERQRIALARAFIRDAPLILLDEATAHLDPISEAAVADAVRRLARDRTVIAVAHRPALLAGSDRVVDFGVTRTAA
jgi:ATP-binding cassette, subfamily C, bacterial CydCD